MATRGRRLIVGNWKMNGVRADLTVVAAADAVARQRPDLEIGLALPATLIAAARSAAVAIGAQDIHALDSGPHTGCISAPMVRDAGASFTLVGHSERRAGESDQDIAGKVAAARRQGLSAILCVGESQDVRDGGGAEAHVAAQLQAALPADDAGDWLSVAYEPIWAIGTGRSATLDDIAAMHAMLRTICPGSRLLYGGSVTATTAADILGVANVDGVLVGGASLSAESFSAILEAA